MPKRSLARLSAGTVVAAACAMGAGTASHVAAAAAWHNVVYVANRSAGGGSSGSVTAYDVATATTTQIATPGLSPRWVAITPDGGTAVVSTDDGHVLLIDTASATITHTLTGVGGGGVAISPDGTTAWAVSPGAVTPITIASASPGTAIALPAAVTGNCGSTYPAGGIVITGDGTTAYAVDTFAEAVVPINLVTRSAGAPISVSACPVHIALGVEDVDPFVYVSDNTNNEVDSIYTPTDQVMSRLTSTPDEPYGIAETWSGVYWGDINTGAMRGANAYPSSGTPASFPACPTGEDLAFAPDGQTAWISQSGSAYSVATPISGSSCPHGAGFSTDPYARGIAVTPELLATTGTPITPTAGQAFSATVATFSDPNTARAASEFKVNIDWGDGSSSSPGTVSGSSGSFSVSGSHSYSSYGTYTVSVQIAFDLSHPFDVTTTATVPGPPGPPTSFDGMGGHGRVLLAWSAPVHDNGSAVTGYDVYVGTSSGGESTTPANATPITGTGYTVTGLTDGTPYYFEVQAINGYGHGAPSAEISRTPVPDDYTISVSPGFQWLNPGQTVSYSVVTSNTSGLGQTLTFAITGLPKSVSAHFANASIYSGDSDLLLLTATSAAPGSKLTTFTVTANGSETTHSATAQVQVVPIGVVNGGFSTGTLKGWTKHGTVSVISGMSADGDGHAAQVGSATSTSRVSSVSETLQVPSGASGITFSWWGYCNPDPYDQLIASVKDLTTGKGGQVFATCQLSSGWTSQRLAVTAGDVVTITLSVRDDLDTGAANYALFDAVATQ